MGLLDVCCSVAHFLVIARSSWAPVGAVWSTRSGTIKLPLIRGSLIEALNGSEQLGVARSGSEFLGAPHSELLGVARRPAKSKL